MRDSTSFCVRASQGLSIQAMSDPESHELLKQYQAGQTEAAAEIFNRYVERLIALARTCISPKLHRRVDAEDVVQSAYRSFFVHARNEEYQLTRSGDLWRLLARTTLNKLYGQIEKATAGKRSVARELTGEVALDDIATREPTVVEVVAIGEQLQLILDRLSSDEQLVLSATLQGQSIEEISTSLGKSERTVRRLLQQAKQQFENRLLRKESPRKAEAVPSIDASQTPLAFSDYVLEKLIGAGGMGKVYRARDRRTGGRVAFKALHKSLQSDQRAVAQIVQESNILARLRHPNIVGVHGLGRFPGGGYFIVMDFIQGNDLQTRLKSGSLPNAEAVSIIKRIAGAVQHAHDRGVIHCDLKPGNILIDEQGRPFVTDFGFAFIRSESPQGNACGMGGTEGYIPPEILRSQSRPTPATDIFALGALLWALTKGKPPNDSDLCQTRGAGPLESICRRCLASKPEGRYPTVSDLINALDGIPTSDQR